MTHRRTWQKAEQRNAEFIGAERNPYSGSMSKISSSDSTSRKIYLEMKYRKKMAIFKLWRETKPLADKEGKTLVIALQEKGKKLDLWVIKKEDIKKVVKELGI